MITIALSFHHTIILEGTKYDDINKTGKRKTCTRPYNQGKTYREISKQARISPRDIRIILNKAVEEKKTETKSQQDSNTDVEINQKQQISLSTKAYKLFCEGKSPLEVAIELNLRHSEATGFYKDYWKLKQLHDLNSIYEEIKDDIGYFCEIIQISQGQRQVYLTLGPKIMLNLIHKPLAPCQEIIPYNLKL